MKFTQNAAHTVTAMAISQAINAPAKRALAILANERLLPPMQGHNTLNFESSILVDDGNYRIGLRVKPGTDLAEVRNMLAHMAARGFSSYIGGYTNGEKLMGWTSIYCSRSGFNPWTSKVDYTSAVEVAALTVPSNTDLALHPILGSISFPEESVEEDVTTPTYDAPAIGVTPVVETVTEEWTCDSSVIDDEPADACALMADGLASMSKKQLIQICTESGYLFRKSDTKKQLIHIINEAELAGV